MDAPPLSTAPPISTTPTPPFYPNSVDSSPRSRHTSSYDADPPPPPKLRLMCSYGGRIVPRPHDKTLCYVGGDTRIVVIDRHISLSDLHRRLSKTLLQNQQPFSLKYQLPNEDLDSLISVTADEDLENMVVEYDRLITNSGGGMKKSGRLRLFLFPESTSNIETASIKSEDWFFNALNNGKGSTGSDRGFSESSSVNCLLGLDDDFVGKATTVEKDVEAQMEGLKNENGNLNVNGNYGVNNHDVHSVPGSPMLDTTSSFGSTSSSPSVGNNLPPIRVHVEEHRKVIEEQFQQMGVGNVNSPLRPKEEAGVFTAAGVVAGTVVAGLPVVVGAGEYANRVFSDDERCDHGGYRKVQQIQQQVQAQLQPQQIPQFQQTQNNSAFELPSPDSVSSEGSRPRQATFQEPLIQTQSGNTKISSNQIDLKTEDPNNRSKTQMQPQFQEPSYLLSGQYDQNHPQLHQSQQYIHAGNQYIPAGTMPIASYYHPIYPPQQQHHPILDQQYPVYFASNTQTQAYNQSRNAPSSKPEMAGGIYRTATAGTVQLVQVPSNQRQRQFVGFNPIQHPVSAVNSGYNNYEYVEPTHAQMYYTPLSQQLAVQYQMMSAPSMVVNDASAQLHKENQAAS